MAIEVKEKPARAIVAAVQLREVCDVELQASVTDLGELANTLGFEVVGTFLSSDERYHRVVDQLYSQYFQRHADLTGMAWYASKLKAGEQTVRSLAQSFVAADEYFAQL